MATLAEELTALKTEEDKITGNKVANFSYDDYAYEHNDANGVDTYNVDAHQNIPNGTASILKVNSTILTKGWRAQASAITRMLMNHFLGRCSYNLNKINDHFSTLLTKLISYLGTANGIATLDANGKVTDAQLKLGVANGIATLDSDGKVSDSQLALYKHVITISTMSEPEYYGAYEAISASFECINSSPEALTKTSILSSFAGRSFPAYWELRGNISPTNFTVFANGFTISVSQVGLFFNGYRILRGTSECILRGGRIIGKVDVGGTDYDVTSVEIRDAIYPSADLLEPVSLPPFDYSYELTDTVTPLSDSQ